MTKYEDMSIGELEDARDAITARMTANRTEFRAAGKALEKARANTPEAKLLAKRAKIDEDLAALSAAGEGSDG